MKYLTSKKILGERGINLIQKIILEMGFVFHPTGTFDTGIDGFIEIRDQETGQTTNQIIQLQSKATDGPFQSESDGSFSYYCRQVDLDYWLNGNSPVILVCSRPNTQEAYFVAVKEYFENPQNRASKTIHFDKRANALTVDSKGDLIRLSSLKLSGIYIGPLPKEETLYSNLVHLDSFPSKIFVAKSKCASPAEVCEKLRNTNGGFGWYYKYGSIISFDDLHQGIWKIVCEDPIESQPSSDWAGTQSPDRKNDFVRLLNHSLRRQLASLKIRYERDADCYYFQPTNNLNPRTYKYRSLRKYTTRIVFRPYFTRDGKRVSFYRHSAFEGHFLRIKDDWVLEITPTYFFTHDAYHKHKYSGDLLKKIKEKEFNSAVLGQTLMWHYLVRDTADLFSEYKQSLGFGDLKKFATSTGIIDTSWLKNESAPLPGLESI